MGNYDLTLSVDTTKANWWDNGTLFVYFLGNFGGHPTQFVGDMQGTDNIEAPETFKLYEAWYEHSFFDGKFSFLTGLHDFNSEFDSLDYAGGLMNGSFGISNDISQVGPSIFPATALTARVKVLPTEQSYLQFAAYDGVPGSPNDPHGTQIILKHTDGIFYGGELGLTSAEDEDHYKVALGGWYHTAEYEDFNGIPRDRNHGIYFIAESSVYQESDNEQGLGIFFQSGFAQGDRNQVGNYYGLGFSYTGLVPNRDSDVLTFGMAMARNSNDFTDANSGFERSETVFELNYRVEVLPYLAVQPDIQYVVNPSTDPGLDNSLVVGVRTEIAM